MFVRIRKNTGTNKRSVIVCHSIRNGCKVSPQIVKVVGHSADENELQALVCFAKNWIKLHGEEWLFQNK